MGQDTDAETLRRLSQIFLDNGQYKEAMQLLLSTRQVEKALELCFNQNIALTEELVEKMLPEQGSALRKDLALRIAEKANKQGNFAIASKLYMELGDKVKTMKCLIKLNEPNSVINFASNARSSEIYVLAANFLQTCDWHQNAEIAKNILNFYSKAKSFMHLVSFYEACAMVDVQNYHDYKRALSALQNAMKFVSKCSPQE